MAYSIVRLDNVKSQTTGHLYSVKHETKDIPNGVPVMVGSHYPGEREVRKAIEPTEELAKTQSIALSTGVELNYEQYRSTDAALENYINKQGRPFRLNDLERGDIFSVSVENIETLGTEPTVGATVVAGAGFKFHEAEEVDGQVFVGRIIDVEVMGTSMFAGSVGEIGRVNKLAVIEVVSN